MVTFERISCLKGEVEVPADKSITHRSFILGGMATGTTKVLNPLMSRDTKATKRGMEACGVIFEEINDGFLVHSEGFRKFKEPFDVINCDNSGTTARLLTGLFAPQKKYFVLTGDDSLKKRPMARVIEPLSQMGADIKARDNGRFLPLTILPSNMYGTEIEGKIKSAQVKSAVILSALQTEQSTTYTEPAVTRNHTELMLNSFGANVKNDGLRIIINPSDKLSPAEIIVPGDFSSSAFFIGGALMFENSEILIKNVGLNPTRTGLLNVLETLGVKFELDLKNIGSDPYGDIFIKNQKFSGGLIRGDIIANIIDEIPMLSTLGLFSSEPIEIRDAQELRVKESDRISAVVYNLRELGADVEEYDDGLKVYPLKTLKRGAKLRSFSDHRIAMINILLAKKYGNLEIDEIEAIDVSFPDFLKKIDSITVK